MKIGLLLYPDCIPSGLFAFSDLLLAANMRVGKPLFECCWVSERGKPFVCANGMELSASKLQNVDIDALVIPGSWRDQSNIHNAKDENLVHTIATLDKKIQVLSYCTGVYLAARSGRLKKQTATTTWWLLDTIREHFPDIQWQLNSTFVLNKRNATAAGVTGSLPIAMALIEQQCGNQIANEIQQYMVLPRPVERNTPFQALPALIQQNQFLRDVFHWVEKCPYTELKASLLAEHLNTTPRTLSRKIISMTGYKSARLLRLIKLNQVSDQLISTNKSIDTISIQLGFSDNTSLRRSFKQITGMTPGEYRRVFG